MTAPAATLALTLMFLRTNDSAAAAHFGLPAPASASAACPLDQAASAPPKAAAFSNCPSTAAEASRVTVTAASPLRAPTPPAAASSSSSTVACFGRAELDACQPDLLLLRVMGRALVMWETTQPERAWVEGQLPPLVKVGGWGDGRDR